MRVSYDELKELFNQILLQRGLYEDDAALLAKIVADNSLDGVYTHGVNRFPRLVSNIEDGVVDRKARTECLKSFGSFECWTGHFGIGPINAYRAMERACELAKENGIGLVALGWNNHWLRGSTYGLLAAESGCIGICWSNTKPNMPAWGGREPLIGNNPLIIAVPERSGAHFVFDAALSQYSYGKLEEYRLKGQELPYYGGFDDEDELTKDPAVIEKNGRMLPIGYWKGSGLSIALDLVASVLSNGASVKEVGELENERGLSQVMIAADPSLLHSQGTVDSITASVLEGITSASGIDGRHLRYPGQRLAAARKENLEHGIPVIDSVWERILALNKG